MSVAVSGSRMERRSRPEREFLMVRNAFFRDKSLTLAAKAIGAWLMTHTESFTFTVSRIASANDVSMHVARQALKCLEERRYLVRTREQDQQTGQFGQWVYSIDDTPVTDDDVVGDVTSEDTETSRSNPPYENPEGGFAAPLKKTDSSKKTQDSKETPSEGHPNAAASVGECPAEPEPVIELHPIPSQRGKTTPRTRGHSPRRSSPGHGPVLFGPRNPGSLDDNTWTQRAIASFAMACRTADVALSPGITSGLATDVLERLQEGETREKCLGALETHARRAWQGALPEWAMA